MGKGTYIGTRPSKASVERHLPQDQRVRRRRGTGRLLRGEMVEHLNRAMTGWANYFCLGQVSPAYHAIDRHAVKRLRQWLCRKHKVRSGGYVRFSDERLRETYGLTCLASKPQGFPWAKA